MFPPFSLFSYGHFPGPSTASILKRIRTIAFEPLSGDSVAGQHIQEIDRYKLFPDMPF